MSYLSIRKWNEYQHYKNRNPVWIKYHVKTLDNERLLAMPVPVRYLWTQLLLLAAKYDNAIPNDSELIAKLLRMHPEHVREGVRMLSKAALIKETRSRRRASKPASKKLATELETEKDYPPDPPFTEPASNGTQPHDEPPDEGPIDNHRFWGRLTVYARLVEKTLESGDEQNLRASLTAGGGLSADEVERLVAYRRELVAAAQSSSEAG